MNAADLFSIGASGLSPSAENAAKKIFVDGGAPYSKIPTVMNFIQIPQIGRVPAYSFDPMNREQVRTLIRRADSYFHLSKKAWEDANEGGLSEEEYKRLDEEECQCARNGEALLTPLGIEVQWPGLYPSFKVKGFWEYSTEMAVLSALGHPRNWLRDQNGAA